ncbi:MAG TPA: DUF4270 family protein [Saprospiraceae bacterium]|nr:DUF4270 family protein [Saprospiraceae bacterium]
MKFNLKLGLLVSICSLIGFIRCNEPDTVGNELLQDEWIYAKGIDTFSHSLTYIQTDSIPSFTPPSNSLKTFMVGHLDDPLFGSKDYAFAIQPRFVPVNPLDFLKRPIDSIVFSLRYDSLSFYGDRSKPMDIEVYQLEEFLDANKTYLMKDQVKISNNKLGEIKNVVANAKDSVSVTLNKITSKLLPQLRIPMDTGKFMSILRSFHDTTYNSADYFVKAFQGLAIVAKNAQSVIAFKPENVESKITLYYKGDTSQLAFDFVFSNLSVKVPIYTNSYQGARVESFINGTDQDFVFMDGAAGFDTRLKIPYNPALEGKFINFAVLELTVPKLPGDDSKLFPLCEYVILEDLTTGSKVPIPITDVLSGITNLAVLRSQFGGNPFLPQGSQFYKYKMNLSAHFISAFRSKKDIDLIITPLYKPESAARAMFYGSQYADPSLKSKLSITISE